MANLKEVRERIQSVNTIKQITTAMKLVSASKLRRAQDNIVKLRPYAGKLREIMTRVSSNIEDLPDEGVFNVRKVEKVLCVVFSSNKGLCGGFNSSMGKHVISVLNDEYAEQFKNNNIDFINLGNKIPVFLKKSGIVFKKDYNHLIDHPSYEEISKIADEFIQAYIDKKYDAIVLFYNEFKNASTQINKHEVFLPFSVKSEGSVEGNSDYILEPEEEKLFQTLVPKTLKIQLFKALLDSVASEHGARMTAMHTATDNATELIRDLKLSYNKARQSAITNEIIEIVSGAEALKG